jgi:23S rRNA G2445 N2-methylase RlmL
MAEAIDPTPKAEVYDPACGSGGLLIKARLVYERLNPDQRHLAPKLHSQELNPTTFAIVDELNGVLDRAVEKEPMKAPDRVPRVAANVADHFRENVEPIGFTSFLLAALSALVPALRDE